MAPIKEVIHNNIEWLTLIAVIIGPILAVQTQKWIEKLQATRQRRLRVFRILMSTRATPLVKERVEALNLIDIEFQGTGKKEKAVLDQWKICLDHLNNGPRNPSSPDFQSVSTVWNNKLLDLNAKLLEVMGQSLGYNFDEVQIKRGSYSPQAHGDLEAEGQQLRKGLIDILTDKKSFSVHISNLENDKPQKS